VDSNVAHKTTIFCGIPQKTETVHIMQRKTFQAVVCYYLSHMTSLKL